MRKAERIDERPSTRSLVGGWLHFAADRTPPQYFTYESDDPGQCACAHFHAVWSIIPLFLLVLSATPKQPLEHSTLLMSLATDFSTGRLDASLHLDAHALA